MAHKNTSPEATSEEPVGPGEVVRGVYVLTAGFSVMEENVSIPFDLLLQGLHAVKMSETFNVGDKAVGLDEVAPDWAKHLTKDEYSRNIREYAVRDTIDPSGHDELLARLFFRKTTLLTSKGRAGLKTIKLRDISGVSVTLSDTAPNARDEGSSPHKRLAMKGDLPMTMQDVTPMLTKSEWKARIRILLQVQTVEPNAHGTRDAFEENSPSGSESISRVAAISLVLEPTDGYGNLFKLFSNTDRLRIDLGSIQKQGSTWSDFVGEMRNGCRSYLEGDGVLLLDFLAAVAWLDVLRTIGGAAKSRKTDLGQPKCEVFVRRIHEMRNEISFHYKEIVMARVPTASLGSLTSDPAWLRLVTRLLGFSSGLEQDQEAYVQQRAIQLTPYTIFALNRGLYLSDVKDHPEGLFSQGILDYSEWGHRWGVSWALLMSSMLCLLAQTFMIYNREMEEHVSERKEAAELRDLTHKAFEDFASFYDVDLIQAHLYKEEFETAKETFGIGGYYDILIKRLTLFSNYEIAAEASKLSRAWFRFSLVIGIAGVLIAIILKLWP